MKIVSAKELGKDKIRKLLVKPPFDEVQLNPKIREANRKIFGADLTAAEVAVRIVEDVRRHGDEAVIKYTKLIDGTDFSPEDFRVSEEEFAEAEKNADPAIVASLERAAHNVRS